MVKEESLRLRPGLAKVKKWLKKKAKD